jgi:hypothetical protein
MADRCDPAGRQLAAGFSIYCRFWTYRQIAGDSTGRIAQIASTCPGLLLIASVRGEELVAEDGGSRPILQGILDGRSLDTIVAAAAKFALSKEVLDVGSANIAGFRVQCLGKREHEAVVAAKRLMIRRARATVGVLDLLAVPPPRFAPEDIPTGPIANARWFAMMHHAQAMLWGVDEAPLRGALSSFVSANAELLLSRARGPANPRPRLLGPCKGDVVALLQKLLRYLRAKGRMPVRSCNPRKLLSEMETWDREEADESGTARLGALLRRIPALDIGEVESVSFLGNHCGLTGLERMRLPRAPCGDGSSVPGLRVAQLQTPESLASAGATQNHCVATWLPEVWAGRAWIFDARQGDIPITVALVEDAHGRLRIEDARLAENVRPSPFQMRLLETWVDRTNKVKSALRP